MRKKIFGGIAVFAIAAVVAFNVNLSSEYTGTSLLTLSNVEALATQDTGEDCPGPKVENRCLAINSVQCTPCFN